jgi:hypothetical protein
MRGARASEFCHYWMRFNTAFWGGRELEWVRDNVLVACLCSIAPGLIAAGLGAALSDDKWRVATYATLLTYTGLFVLFLAWRLAHTPFELDQELQQFITGLSKSLRYTRSKLIALQARPPAIDAEILEIHFQTETTPASRNPKFSVDCDIFLRVELRLWEMRPCEVLGYELSAVLHGNSQYADFLDDISSWGLVTVREPIGIGSTFRYMVSRLTPLVGKLDRAGVPVEGWLHFRLAGVHERDIGATVYRLNVITPNGAVSVDTRGDKNLARVERRQFLRLPSVSGRLAALSRQQFETES